MKVLYWAAVVLCLVLPASATENTCIADKQRALSNGDRYVPTCSQDGLYNVKQCEPAEDNLALGRPTLGSRHSFNGTSALAVDNNPSILYWEGSCTHTFNIKKPWWAVELKKLSTIEEVHITNRGDCCGERLSNISIGTTRKNPADDPELSYGECAYQGESLGMGETKMFICFATGKYLIIQLKKSDILTLCEVKVFGAASTNLALYQNTYSTEVVGGGYSKHAVDGYNNPDFSAHSCSTTKAIVNPWWSVQLKEISSIRAVSITNRGGSYFGKTSRISIGTMNEQPFDSSLDYKECAYQRKGLENGETKLFPCSAIGKFLIIQLKRHDSVQLNLCEVKVFGVPVKNECWCVNQSKGDEITGTRKQGDVQC